MTLVDKLNFVIRHPIETVKLGLCVLAVFILTDLENTHRRKMMVAKWELERFGYKVVPPEEEL